MIRPFRMKALKGALAVSLLMLAGLPAHHAQAQSDQWNALYDRIAAAGADVIEPIWDAPWGLRQFSIVDPDGNLTTFHAA